MPPGPPDSKPPRRGTRAPSLADTLDEADERAQAAAAVIERDRAAAAVIERDVREGLAAEQPVLSTPRARTPAEVELRKTIDELRRLQPEWHVAEQTARSLEQLADVIEQERTDRLAVDDKKKHADEIETARQSWRGPVWKAAKAIAAALALTIAGAATKALIDYGDNRRAAAQQAEVIRLQGAKLVELTEAIDRERSARADADASLREAIAADHAVLSLFASRAGIPAPFPIHP